MSRPNITLPPLVRRPLQKNENASLYKEALKKVCPELLQAINPIEENITLADYLDRTNISFKEMESIRIFIEPKFYWLSTDNIKKFIDEYNKSLNDQIRHAQELNSKIFTQKLKQISDNLNGKYDEDVELHDNESFVDTHPHTLKTKHVITSELIDPNVYMQVYDPISCKYGHYKSLNYPALMQQYEKSIEKISAELCMSKYNSKIQLIPNPNSTVEVIKVEGISFPREIQFLINTGYINVFTANIDLITKLLKSIGKDIEKVPKNVIPEIWMYTELNSYGVKEQNGYINLAGYGATTVFVYKNSSSEYYLKVPHGLESIYDSNKRLIKKEKEEEPCYILKKLEQKAGAIKYKYKGRMYKIRIGARGGKYIQVKDAKIYIN